MSEEKEEEKGSLGETAGQEAGQRIGKQLGSKIGGAASEGAGAVGTGAGAAGAEGAAAGAGSAAGTVGGTAAGTAGGTAAGTAAGVGAGAAGGAAAGATAGSVVPVIGTAIGAIAGATIGTVAGKFIKYIIPVIAAIGAIFVFVLLLPIIIVIGLIAIIGGIDPSTGLAIGTQPLSVTKTARTSNGTSQIPKNSTDGTVVYTFNITNSGVDKIANVKVTDSFSGKYTGDQDIDGKSNCNFDVGDVAAGTTVSKTCQINIKRLDDDWFLSNTATVSGTQGGTGATPTSFQGDQIGCLTIKWANGTDDWNPNRETVVRNAIAVPASYPTWLKYLCDASGGTVTLRLDNYGGGINADEYGGTTLRIYADPFLTTARTAEGQAFVMAHELTHIIQTYDNDGVFSKYLASSAYTETLGQSPKKIIRSYPLCTNSSTGVIDEVCFANESPPIYPSHEDFAEMAGNFVAVRDGYPISFQTEYPEHYKFASGTLYASTVSSVVSASATAVVVIGSPAGGPPAYSPLKGNVYISGYNYRESAVNSRDQTYPHEGVDIASDQSGVYSPFPGPAVVYFAGPSSSRPGLGNFVILVSGDWAVLMAHMDPVNVKQGDIVDTNTQLGVMDTTGFAKGPHVHYEIRQSGTLVNPNDYNCVTPHP